ncbi:nicotinate phosphoribosyltransferase [Trueperella pyogenes]|uniref:nicotinate phosphoribosyltransferase n=1 Tax=Trueperella pyogenes TaxID=1661 RepID=UPI000F851469|nr:nicotinate phosphoribosyltransferase [Trueperella pyogenes]AZR01922.1 nicotinate phosphoribosyltransferase [Trueperella pyogenes]UVJ53083.1 nicotinate phosphoribosyltransferase [Trueperella pyogenes]
MTHFSSTALLTDMYELTMIDSAMKSGTANRRSVFEVFGRRLPGHRRYGVVAGVGRALEAVKNFRFGPEEIDYLRHADILSEETLAWLADYRFSGDIYGYREGEIYFPGSPIMTVIGTFAEAVLLETVLLSILNYDSAVATAASRMTIAAHDRPCLDMGARRTHERSAVAAARAAIIGGFTGTSDLEAARLYGIKPIGTAAHSFTLLHDTEEEAFRAQIATMGTETTLLVDTYNVERGVELAVNVARQAGGELGAIRLDSGDLVAQAFKVRKQLDDMGATTTKITVTSDLDEYAIAALGAAPVDSYGVGTRLVTGSGHPTAQLVYKLVSRERQDGTMQSVAKKSDSKTSVGGLKIAGRTHDETGRALAEIVVSAGSWEQGLDYLAAHDARPLQVKLVEGGVVDEKYIARNSLAHAAQRHRNSRAALPYPAWRLSEGDPALPTTMVDIFAGDD